MRHWLNIFIALVASLNLLHAQTAMVGSFNKGLVAVQSATPDSIVQLTADAQGLAQIAPADLPRTGTYWLVMPSGFPAPAPCPPLDPGVPVYQMASGQFLVDETGGQVTVNPRRFGMQAQSRSSAVTSALAAQANTVLDLITRVETTTANQQMLAMGLDVPSPGGGGGGGTNDYAYSFTPPVYTTNDLWLSMNGVTNTTAYITIHPPWNVTNSVYDLLYTTNLSSPETWQWVLRTYPKQTSLAVSNATDPHGFYWLNSANDITANDSLGTNFWIAFYDMQMNGVNLSLYISSPAGASGIVAIPGLGFTNTFTVAAGAVTNISLPPEAMMGDYDAVENYGIHITASQPVSVYGVDYSEWVTTSFTGYPTPMLGTDYCIMSRAPLDVTGESFVPNPSSQFAIVATETNTMVTIWPSPTANLWYHTNAYCVMMNEGQTYQIPSRDITNDVNTIYDVLATNDVTGTWITSDKPIAVFAGATSASVPDANTGANNPLMQEQMPVEGWGTNILALSFAGRLNGDIYRVLAAYSNTVITITGTVVTIVNETTQPSYTVTTKNEQLVITNQAGEAYDIIVDGPVVFSANRPIQVAQFANGVQYDHFYGNNFDCEGDPCEILLPPTGHYLETNTVFALSYDGVTGDFDESYMNIIVPQSAMTSTLVDGSAVEAASFVPIGGSGFYGAQLYVTPGTHTVSSSQPVGVEVYGWGSMDAYGYFGGVVK
jgi:hypothetical protein